MSKILQRLNDFHDMGVAHTWLMKYEWQTPNGVMGLYSAKYEESIWLLIWDGNKLHAIDSYWDWNYAFQRAEIIAHFAGVFEYSIGE